MKTVKHILITGGAGYIGSTLTPLLLASGYRVRVLDALRYGSGSLLGVWANPAFEFIHGDVRNEVTLQSALKGVDAVVHLAAIVGDPACAREPDLARSVNLDASLLLLRMSREVGVSRFIFASTCSNYGKMKDPNVYVDETSELSPVSLYAETKVLVEKEVLQASIGNSFSCTGLRFATVYGVSPRMRFDLTVNEFAMEMIAKKRLVVFGEKFWRPYIHVRDIASAVLSVVESPENLVCNQVFNVGSTDQNYQKQTLVKMILPYAPDAVVEFVHKNEDPRDYRVSFAKINERLGYKIEHEVNDGIKEISQLVCSGIAGPTIEIKCRN